MKLRRLAHVPHFARTAGLPPPYGLESLKSGVAPRDPGTSASSADTGTENLARALYGAWSEGALPAAPTAALTAGAATAGPLRSTGSSSTGTTGYGTAGGSVAAAAAALGEADALIGSTGGIAGMFGRGTLRQASMRLADTAAALQHAHATLAASADGASAVADLTASVNELRAQVSAVLAAVQARSGVTQAGSAPAAPAAAPGAH